MKDEGLCLPDLDLHVFSSVVPVCIRVKHNNHAVAALSPVQQTSDVVLRAQTSGSGSGDQEELLPVQRIGEVKFTVPYTNRNCCRPIRTYAEFAQKIAQT